MAPPWLLEPCSVRACGCVKPSPKRLEGRAEDLFRRAHALGLDALDVAERRGHVPAVTGAVAEAVAPRIFKAHGVELVAQLTDFGARGVGLLLLTPGANVLAVEVKGTLRGGLPRLRRGRLRQMSAEWLDSANAAMLEWDLGSLDVCGGVLAVDLARCRARLAITGNYGDYLPVTNFDDLDDSLRALDRLSPGDRAAARNEAPT